MAEYIKQCTHFCAESAYTSYAAMPQKPFVSEKLCKGSTGSLGPVCCMRLTRLWPKSAITPRPSKPVSAPRRLPNIVYLSVQLPTPGWPKSKVPTRICPALGHTTRAYQFLVLLISSRQRASAGMCGKYKLQCWPRTRLLHAELWHGGPLTSTGPCVEGSLGMTNVSPFAAAPICTDQC